MPRTPSSWKDSLVATAAGSRSIVLVASACWLLAALPASASTGPSHSLAWTGGEVAYEANRGQMPDSVLYRVRTASYAAWLTGAGVVLDPAGPGAAVSFDWIRPSGAAALRPQSGEPLRGVHHYLLGGERSAWVKNVPRYESVLLPEVFPGVDVRFRDGDAGVRYDFEVAAGADPSAVLWAVRGAERVAVDGSGRLLVESAAGGRLEQPAPRLFQEVAGRQVAVDGRYRLISEAGGEVVVGFEVGPWDRSRRLIIDPTILVFSSFLGGSDVDAAVRVKFDADGDVYLVGSTASADFPAVGAAQPAFGGVFDAFVAKVAEDGSALLWSTFIGGSENDGGIDLHVDAAESVYFCGETISPDLPATPGALDETCGDDGICSNNFAPDGFFGKLGPNGDTLEFLSYLGAEDYDRANGIYGAPDGTVYLTGFTESNQFQTTPGAFQELSAGNADVFVTRVTADGSALVFSTLIGGGLDDSAVDIAVDGAGEITVAGSTFSDDYPVLGNPAPFQATFGGLNSDVIVSRLNADATELVFSTYLGGSELEFVLDLDVDAVGNAWLGGYTQSPDFPVAAPPGAVAPYQVALNGARDGFVAAIDPTGSALYMSTFFGGSFLDEVFSFVLLPAGDLLISGSSNSLDLPIRDAFQRNSAGGRDGFLAQLGDEGATLDFSTYFGGAGDDFVNGVEQLPGGDFIFAGSAEDPNGFPLLRPFQPVFGGVADGFVARLTYIPPVQEIPTVSQVGLAVLVLLLAAVALRRLR